MLENRIAIVVVATQRQDHFGIGIGGTADARRDQLHVGFVRCLAEKLLVYALGRAPTSQDGRALDRLVGCSAGLDATFADLVVGIARTDGFRRRRGETK